MFLQNFVADKLVNHFLLAEYPQQVVFFKYQRNVGVYYGVAAALQTDDEAVPFVADVR